MSPSALALVGYVAWNLLLAAAIISYRTGLVLAGKHGASGFDPDGADISGFSARLCRAHANCYENLPMFGGLILLAIATGHVSITDPLARWVLVFRVAQSIVHLISANDVAVTVRAGLYSAQLGIMGYWVVRLGMLGFQ